MSAPVLVPMARPDPKDVVAYLEELLADAKAGKLAAIGFAIVTSDRETEARWATVEPMMQGNTSGLIAAAAGLQHMLCCDAWD